MPDIYEQDIAERQTEELENRFQSEFDAFLKEKEKEREKIEEKIHSRVMKKSKDKRLSRKKLEKIEKEITELSEKHEESKSLAFSGADVSDKARKRGNSIDIKNMLFSKKSKIGRHGQKKLAESNDSIKRLDDNGMSEGVYFDPFGKVIFEKDDEENDNRSVTEKELNRDFLKRVEEQKKLMQKNDFEKELYGKTERDFVMLSMIHMEWQRKNYEEGRSEEDINLSDVSEDIKKRAKERYAGAFNYTQAYTKDFGEGVEKVPDKFEVVVAVDPPTDVYIDYNKDVTEKTPFVMKSLRARPDFYGILDSNVRKSSDYAEITAKGREDANAAGLQYDPDKDPNVDILRAQVAHAINKEQGHSFIRMVASKGGSAVHGYSFGFWPLASTPGIGAVTMGEVRNPDPEAREASIIERRHEVSYANYLRAATKIRGTMGSQRTYSFLGYNCTSFAADMAAEAGVPIKKMDSGDYMTTFRSRKALIDSPYSLAKYVRAGHSENAEASEQAMNEWTKLSLSERFDQLALRRVKKAIAGRKNRRNAGKALPGIDSVNDTLLVDANGQELLPEADGGKSAKKKEDQYSYEVTFAGQEIRNKRGRTDKANVKKLNESKILKELYTSLAKNPRFIEIYESIRSEDAEANLEDCAHSILVALIDYLQNLLKSIEENYERKMENIEVSDEENSGDPMEKARESLIKERRAILKGMLGVDTAIEFIVKACNTEEGLNKAFKLLSESGDEEEIEVSETQEEPTRYFGEDIPEELVACKPRADAIAERLYEFFGASYDIYSGTIDLVVGRLLGIVGFDANTITDVRDKCALIAYASVLIPDIANKLEAMVHAGQCCDFIKNMEESGVLNGIGVYDLYDMMVLANVIRFAPPELEEEKKAVVSGAAKASVPETEEREVSNEDLKKYIPIAEKMEKEILEKLKDLKGVGLKSESVAKCILNSLDIEAEDISFEESCRVIAYAIALDTNFCKSFGTVKNENALMSFLNDIEKGFSKDNIAQGNVDILRSFMQLGEVINLTDEEDEEYDEEDEIEDDATVSEADAFINNVWTIYDLVREFTDFFNADEEKYFISVASCAAKELNIPIADLSGNRLDGFVACLIQCDETLVAEIKIAKEGLDFMSAVFKIRNVKVFMDEKKETLFRVAWKTVSANL